MAEEHKCQSPPEGHRLCANNCGFFGSAGTLNLCSKCYRDLHLNSTTTNIPSPTPITLKSPPANPAHLVIHEPHLSSPAIVPNSSSSSSSSQPTRCGACHKRVGLMGFRCRCGETYCGSHRYPEKHTCRFDFKSVGKDAIARANPVVKAAKLDRI